MKLKGWLLAGAALATTTPAFADDAAVMKRLDDMQRMIEQQQQHIADQDAEISNLKAALGGKKGKKIIVVQQTAAPATPSSPATQEQFAAQQAQIDRLALAMDNANNAARLDKQDKPSFSFVNARPTFSSPDGRFSMSVRLLGQFDAAYYSQDAHARLLPTGSDLNSGANFRRAQIGFGGTLFGDWSYLFNTEFGGSGGTETMGRVQSLYIEYDGLKPFAFRVGAYPPPGGLEDNTSSQDTIFLERAAPSDVLRNSMGGDGRDAMSIIYATDTIFGALSYTGSKVADAATFDEQSALLARLSASLYSDADSRIVLSTSGGYVIKAPDTSATSTLAHALTLSSSPELTVDGTKLIGTPSIDVNHLTIWGVEGGVQWQNLYGQGGYFHYTIDPRVAGPDQNYDGWYLQGTWVITGESRGYNTANGAFTSPKPRIPFSLDGHGWGAWELAARYDDVDFNDNPSVIGSPLPANGVRGGDQHILTVGMNWYPNSILRFAFDWQNIEIDRLGTIAVPLTTNTEVGQRINAVSVRSQISL